MLPFADAAFEGALGASSLSTRCHLILRGTVLGCSISSQVMAERRVAVERHDVGEIKEAVCAEIFSAAAPCGRR